jgi:hypothetical protein
VNRKPRSCGWILAVWLSLAGAGSAEEFATIAAPGTASGYLARLLINENPFPGERGYVSVEDSKAGMRQVLWALHSRMHDIPPVPPPKNAVSVARERLAGLLPERSRRDILRS